MLGLHSANKKERRISVSVKGERRKEKKGAGSVDRQNKSFSQGSSPRAQKKAFKGNATHLLRRSEERPFSQEVLEKAQSTLIVFSMN